ncbi:MAG: hypothetical protein IJM77_04155 [Spirochaetia bacterium]|nr:hypothetical protein [Spirochaetia bacterium]MBQ3648396.1 hypothetical protein [Spirochaetia bacterium]MBQ3713690.1 hypothetical protein [Spirochaetia bacterium]MBQ6673791.1 hypothetical protein [Spirochaetia bacterium]MBR0318283.1 hypothetical protein [Spirochaetia bacterium]
MNIDEELEKYGVWIKKGPMDSPKEDSEPLDLIPVDNTDSDAIQDDILKDEIPEIALDAIPDEIPDSMRSEVRSILIRLDQLLNQISPPKERP